MRKEPADVLVLNILFILINLVTFAAPLTMLIEGRNWPPALGYSVGFTVAYNIRLFRETYYHEKSKPRDKITFRNMALWLFTPFGIGLFVALFEGWGAIWEGVIFVVVVLTGVKWFDVLERAYIRCVVERMKEGTP